MDRCRVWGELHRERGVEPFDQVGLPLVTPVAPSYSDGRHVRRCCWGGDQPEPQPGDHGLTLAVDPEL